MNVYQRLNAARDKFHSLELKKTGHNKFAGYTYFELGDFLVPALRVFSEHGLCAYVSFERDLAVMMIRNTEKPDECIVLSSPLSEANLKGCHPVQNVGACETYARRYLWVAALEIVEHDALDATTGKDAKGDKTQVIAPARISADASKSVITEERQAVLYKELDEVLALASRGKTQPIIDWFYSLTDNEEIVLVNAEIPAGLRTLIKRNAKEQA